MLLLYTVFTGLNNIDNLEVECNALHLFLKTYGHYRVVFQKRLLPYCLDRTNFPWYVLSGSAMSIGSRSWRSTIDTEERIQEAIRQCERRVSRKSLLEDCGFHPLSFSGMYLPTSDFISYGIIR